ncbi:glycine cleavage system protein GcvH [Mucilaginibacter sp. SG564]|uniref:glycine cleavage system protein GcvH n=1 Tax=unclassified Mucilaginibacter TaxID=2617802 RepID=UPI001552492A|nr:glycine cleavage system protein GcvH [Mucilaginibacter sp. SG564]NOW94425.1 glycine cleavage system H protein [Mucilaginibacter sp. SG564]
MDFPSNLKYTRDHEWVLAEGDTATIGVTEFAQRELGDIVFVDIPTVGKKIEQEEVFGTIEAVKTVSDVFMPVAGEIIQFNEELESSPEIINEDPYGDGWIVKIKLKDPKSVNSLLSADEYKKLIDQ